MNIKREITKISLKKYFTSMKVKSFLKVCIYQLPKYLKLSRKQTQGKSNVLNIKNKFLLIL